MESDTQDAERGDIGPRRLESKAKHLRAGPVREQPTRVLGEKRLSRVTPPRPSGRPFAATRCAFDSFVGSRLSQTKRETVSIESKHYVILLTRVPRGRRPTSPRPACERSRIRTIHSFDNRTVLPALRAAGVVPDASRPVSTPTSGCRKARAATFPRRLRAA